MYTQSENKYHAGNKILLQYDETWGALINHYEERGCVLHESQFPTKEDLYKLPKI